jgi:hypothetical protein
VGKTARVLGTQRFGSCFSTVEGMTCRNNLVYQLHVNYFFRKSQVCLIMNEACLHHAFVIR